MYAEYLSTIGLSKEQLTQELSQQPITAETVAAVIAHNNQEMLSQINGALSTLIDAIEKSSRKHP